MSGTLGINVFMFQVTLRNSCLLYKLSLKSFYQFNIDNTRSLPSNNLILWKIFIPNIDQSSSPSSFVFTLCYCLQSFVFTLISVMYLQNGYSYISSINKLSARTLLLVFPSINNALFFTVISLLQTKILPKYVLVDYLLRRLKKHA